MKPTPGTMQRAEAGRVDAWLPSLSYLTRALSRSKGLRCLQAYMGQSTLTELSRPPWVRMTVIFVAENVEPPRVFTALHPYLSHLHPTMNVFIVRMAVLLQECPPHVTQVGGTACDGMGSLGSAPPDVG